MALSREQLIERILLRSGASEGERVLYLRGAARMTEAELADVERDLVTAFEGISEDVTAAEALLQNYPAPQAPAGSAQRPIVGQSVTPPSRRQILQGAAQIFAAAIFPFGLAQSPSVLSVLPAPLIAAPPPPVRGQLIELLFGSRSPELALVPNWENSAVAEFLRKPEASYATARAAADLARVLTAEKLRVQELSEPLAVEPGPRDIIAFGFETSQPLYRRIAGYLKTDTALDEWSGYKSAPEQGPFSLPWRSNLNTAADANEPSNYRFSTIAGHRVKRRIWELRHADGRRLRPQYDSDLCIVDYISIVHIPSYLAGDNEHALTLMGGIESAGTESIAAMCTQSNFVALLQKRVPGRWWQAIVKVQFNAAQPTFSLEDVSPVIVDPIEFALWRSQPPAW